MELPQAAQQLASWNTDGCFTRQTCAVSQWWHTTTSKVQQQDVIRVFTVSADTRYREQLLSSLFRIKRCRRTSSLKEHRDNHTVWKNSQGQDSPFHISQTMTKITSAGKLQPQRYQSCKGIPQPMLQTSKSLCMHRRIRSCSPPFDARVQTGTNLDTAQHLAPKEANRNVGKTKSSSV